MRPARTTRSWLRSRINAPGEAASSAMSIRLGWRMALLAFLSSLSWLTVSLAAQDPKPAVYPEYQVKAAYLTDLGRYVEKWSARANPSPDEPFDLCVLGQDPFGAALDDAVKGEKIGGSPLEAKRISRPQDALGCRILYIGSTEESQLSTVIAVLGTAPVLTVADIPDFVKHGGMIQFVLDGNHVHFEINIAAAQRAGLKLSSELLKVARSVRRSP
jgi:hypothetical protein